MCVMHGVVLHLLLFTTHGLEKRIRGIFGRRAAPLYFTIKMKIPRKAPWGELPGKDLGLEFAPLYPSTMDLPDRYEIRIKRSQEGTCIS